MSENSEAVGAPVEPSVRPLPAPHYPQWSHSNEHAAWTERQVSWIVSREVAAERGRIDQLLRDHQGVSLETLEYLETMRIGPTREQWAELDARARGDGEPGCRDCADNNGTCPHDGHKCGA